MTGSVESLMQEKKKESLMERFPELATIPPENFPQHVFIIPDGNRRFAKSEGKEAIQGHKKGLENTLNIFRDLRELDSIKYVTLSGLFLIIIGHVLRRKSMD